jgi:hypothetical protein
MNFADPQKIEEASRLRSQGWSLRQISKETGLHRETIIAYTGKITRSDSMRIYHARRKGMVIEMDGFKVKEIVRPTKFVPIDTPVVPLIRRGFDLNETRFKKHMYLVQIAARLVLRKTIRYDLKTLEHFGTIGLWDACKRFKGDEALP